MKLLDLAKKTFPKNFYRILTKASKVYLHLSCTNTRESRLTSRRPKCPSEVYLSNLGSPFSENC